MSEAVESGQGKSFEELEAVRAQRIKEVREPLERASLQHEVHLREKEVSEKRAEQEASFKERVERLRNEKTNPSNGHGLAPSGHGNARYRGSNGQIQAEIEAKAETQANDKAYLHGIANKHNVGIDERLDTLDKLQAKQRPAPEQNQSPLAERLKKQKVERAEEQRQRVEDRAARAEAAHKVIEHRKSEGAEKASGGSAPKPAKTAAEEKAAKRAEQEARRQAMAERLRRQQQERHRDFGRER